MYCALARKQMHVGFWWESQKEGHHKEDLEICGRIILNQVVREIRWTLMNWTYLAEDRNQLRALNHFGSIKC
jgi:hypothetical protein